MQYQYLITSITYDDIHTYGIAAAVNYDGCFVVIESYIDLSTDKDSIEHLVELCNNLHLDVLHLRDIVDDFLTDLC